MKVSTVQFEHKSGDKTYNLSVIERFVKEAAAKGADAICFHECSISGYTFSRKLSKQEMLQIAEFVPGGTSLKKLQEIAGRYHIAILAGLFEKDSSEKLYNTFVCVNENGLIARHRKIHPFINQYLSPGDAYTIFELNGWKCGILTCYDNNIPENVRATRLLGAEIIFMPHVTMCTPSARPGAGFVDPQLWYNKENDPTSLRLEFDGMKGRAWLMKWLPARAYDNAIYAVFANPVGMDDDQLKNGCSMIIDPFGDIINECRESDDCMVTATLTRDKLTLAGGYRYLNARRTALYEDILTQVHHSAQKVAWLQEKE